MNVNKEAFLSFIKAHGNMFPFSEVRQTRNQLHEKWIILSCPKYDVKVMPQHMTLCSHSVDWSTRQHLIMSGKGIPSAPDFNDILDCTENWRSVSGTWRQFDLKHVVCLAQEKVAPARRGLFFTCVNYQVKELLFSFGLNADLGFAIYQAWILHFFEMYDTREKDFYWLSIRSFEFIREKVNFNQDVERPNNVVSGV